MAILTYDFVDDDRIEQGATFRKTFVWKPGGTAIDLTTYTARMQIRPSLVAGTVLLELTTGNGRIVLGGTAGSITLVLTAAETAAIDWVKGVYDLELVNGSEVTRFMAGTVKISREVTR